MNESVHPRPDGAQAGGESAGGPRDAAALVEAAKAGDHAAFEELVRRYRGRIFALALHLTGSRSDADDITQDVFLRAYAKLPEFEGRSQFFTWLYRIALHRALNVKRNQGRRRAVVGLEDARVSAAVAVDAEGDPRRALELAETYTHLLAAFDQLSPVLRTTVVLTCLQGLSHKEAAVVLETTEGTISWRVHEARNQLRGTMERLQRDPTPLPQRLHRPSDDAHAHDVSPRSLATALAAFLPASFTGWRRTTG
jgi:RNA polymerase sigma-70 factor (ECF subfamily)